MAWSYLIQRLLSAIPTLFFMILLAFLLIHAAPGGPFDAEKAISAEIRTQLNHHYHLDQPLYQQFYHYVRQLLVHGDFGPSFRYRDFTVNELIGAGLPISMLIGSMAMLLALVIGCSLGLFAAYFHQRPIDHAILLLSASGIAVPGFVIAPLLVLLFSISLRWLPVAGWESGRWLDAVLPVLALSLPQIAYITRLMRGSLLDVLHQPYIKTAYAKGLSAPYILLRHALKPAFLPVLSYLGPASAGILTGSVVVEQIFSIPGIGRYFVQGALNRDYTLVLGVVVVYGGMIIIANFIVDVLYAWLDPQVKY